MNADERLLTEEQQRLVDEAADRIRVLMERGLLAAYEAERQVADEIDQIRLRVLAATGVEIVAQPPEKLPAVHDVRLGDLAELAVSCRHLLAGVDLLAPHVQHGSARTVGAILKTSVDAATGAAAGPVTTTTITVNVNGGLIGDKREFKDFLVRELDSLRLQRRLPRGA